MLSFSGFKRSAASSASSDVTGNSPSLSSSPISRRSARLERHAAAREGSKRVGMRRKAHAQPRVLVGATLALLGAGVWWASAQSGTGAASGAKGAKIEGSTSDRRPITLDDLPTLVRGYGTRHRQESLASLSQASASGFEKQRFALTEIDLTQGSPADEREPAYSPDGDRIAFASNGADKLGANGQPISATNRSDARIDSLNHRWAKWRAALSHLAARPAFGPDEPVDGPFGAAEGARST
jgi:hypothetical protein